jgi:hypothetical protein
MRAADQASLQRLALRRAQRSNIDGSDIQQFMAHGGLFRCVPQRLVGRHALRVNMDHIK